MSGGNLRLKHRPQSLPKHTDTLIGCAHCHTLATVAIVATQSYHRNNSTIPSILAVHQLHASSQDTESTHTLCETVWMPPGRVCSIDSGRQSGAATPGGRPTLKVRGLLTITISCSSSCALISPALHHHTLWRRTSQHSRQLGWSTPTDAGRTAM